MKYLILLAMVIVAAVAAEDQQVDESHGRPHYARTYGGPWGYARRWRRSTDDQNANEHHRRPYYAGYYRPSFGRFLRSVEDPQGDQQTEDLHFRPYYGGYRGNYGYSRPHWG